MDGVVDLGLDVPGKGLLVKAEDVKNIRVCLRANVFEPAAAEVDSDRRLLLGPVDSAIKSEVQVRDYGDLGLSPPSRGSLFDVHVFAAVLDDPVLLLSLHEIFSVGTDADTSDDRDDL